MHKQIGIAVVVGFVAGSAMASNEIKGADILEHPCGITAVKHMDLVHNGKMDEANQLATEAMREEFQEMSDEDREMIADMAQAMSQSGEEFTESIRKGGTLTVDGNQATLQVVTKEERDSGSFQTSWEQEYELSGQTCLIQ